MSDHNRARRDTPACSPHAQRERLREIRDALQLRAEQRRTAQAARLDHARSAAEAGALVRDIVDAAGVSRAYLHRVGIRSVLAAADADPTGSLTAAREVAATLAELDVADQKAKEERRRIALELLDSEAGVSEKDLAADAGVSAEWVRRRFSDDVAPAPKN